MLPTFSVDALFAGKPKPLGPRGAPSSIVKSPVNSLTVHIDRTDEDQQANMTCSNRFTHPVKR